ncbi:MAG: hypothetical protein AMXMBFR77_06500 [Phycisphaerales bacterium]|nr:hypothetical protein [Leptolyngbya sp.]MCZ7632513.1 hypothetical protein [Phycisphaerales bacterium]MDL1905031.1 hypothetical protein [Synechococcales cyanobacterium CNB]GIK19930.1 MAG: hypothetical protein BroJett004_20940 [Planctomycetota bacterium]
MSAARLRIACLAAGVCCAAALLGCSGGTATRTAPGVAATAGPESQDQWDYRRIRFAEAMRGLRIQDGLVRVDEQAAADLMRGLAVADSAPAVARGHALMGENDFTGAAGEYRTAILADGDNARAYEGLGDALLGKRKDGDALAAYRTAAMLDPANADLRLKFAETINRTGDLDGWAAELARIVAFAPEHGEAHARLAVARYYLGDHDGARAHAVQAERFGGAVPPQLKAMIGQ